MKNLEVLKLLFLSGLGKFGKSWPSKSAKIHKNPNLEPLFRKNG